MSISVHDNWIYSHSVDHDDGVIVLHTFYPHSDPPEYTDVRFEGVYVHHFESVCMTIKPPHPSNILFHIEEEDIAHTLERYRTPILSKQKYGWPVHHWEDFDDLARLLTQDGRKSFHIHGTVGLDGFVIAQDMQIVARGTRQKLRAEPAAAANGDKSPRLS